MARYLASLFMKMRYIWSLGHACQIHNLISLIIILFFVRYARTVWIMS